MSSVILSIQKAKHDNQLQQEGLHSRIEIQQRLLHNYAKEIYENIGQVLSLAKMQLFSLNLEKSKNLNEISNTGSLLGKAIADLRSLAKQFTPDEIIKKGFAAAFIAELERLNDAGFCKAVYSVNNKYTNFDEVSELVVFCILQQIIHPVLDINNPGQVHLCIQSKKNKTEIEIERTFKEESLLLNGREMDKIKERLKTINGTIGYKGIDCKILHIIINI
jgi:signal transduction histidine kinase